MTNPFTSSLLCFNNAQMSLMSSPVGLGEHCKNRRGGEILSPHLVLAPTLMNCS